VLAALERLDPGEPVCRLGGEVLAPDLLRTERNGMGNSTVSVTYRWESFRFATVATHA
jgi:hypothetical protein